MAKATDRSSRRRHDQEGGISIVREAGLRRGRQDPSRQDCCSRFAPEYGHPRRSVVYILLCAAERLAHLPRKRQNEWRARQSERRFKSRRVGPVRPPPDRHARSHMQRRLRHLRVRRARGQREDRQVLGRVVPLAAAPSRRADSKSKHSQVSILRPRDRAHRERDAPRPPQRQGQRPACSTELASTFRPLPACPPPGH